MAADARWLLLQICSCCIIDWFETASIEMNMTHQTDLTLVCMLVTNWDVSCDKSWMTGLPKPIVQFPAVENC